MPISNISVILIYQSQTLGIDLKKTFNASTESYQYFLSEIQVIALMQINFLSPSLLELFYAALIYIILVSKSPNKFLEYNLHSTNILNKQGHNIDNFPGIDWIDTIRVEI